MLAAGLLICALLGPADAPPPPDPITRAAFLLTIRGHLAPNHQDATDDALIGAAQQTCAAFDAGATFQDAVMVAVGAGFSGEEAGALIGGAVYALCPGHKNLIPAS